MSDTINLSSTEIGVIVGGLVSIFTAIAAYVAKLNAARTDEILRLNTSHTNDIKEAHKEHREELNAVYAAHNVQLSAIIEKHAQGMERIFQVLEKVNVNLSHFDATIEGLQRALAKRTTDNSKEPFHDK